MSEEPQRFGNTVNHAFGRRCEDGGEAAGCGVI